MIGSRHFGVRPLAQSVSLICLVAGLVVAATPDVIEDDAPRLGTPREHVASRDGEDGAGPFEGRGGRVLAIVAAPNLDVFDRPDDSGYIIGRLGREDRVMVRVSRISRRGWLAISPLPTTICWIARSSLDTEDDLDDERTRLAIGQSPRRRVGRRGGMIRVGNPTARMPGPPRGSLRPGTVVQLVDRDPVMLGRGPAANWVAIVPPPGEVFYIHLDGIRWPGPSPITPQLAEVRASYEREISASSSAATDGKAADAPSWPSPIAAELERIEGIHRTVLLSQPIEEWRLDVVRSSYQELLKQSAGVAGLEEELRRRLGGVTRHEEAAKAAREIRDILDRSHRRDQELARLETELARSERANARAYDAVGFVQPSAKQVDGHKVFALVGKAGSTVAYLDVPPGLDVEPLLARRVGVRGHHNFSEDLGARLISVRDMEVIEPRR